MRQLDDVLRTADPLVSIQELNSFGTQFVEFFGPVSSAPVKGSALFIQTMVGRWPTWAPEHQVISALSANAKLTDWDFRTDIFPQVVLSIDPDQPLLLFLTGLLQWDMGAHGTIMKKYQAWGHLQSIDLEAWSGGNVGAWATAMVGAICSVYWSLDERVEVLGMVDDVLRVCVEQQFWPLIHPLTSVVLDAAVEVARGPVGEEGIRLMSTWQDVVGRSVMSRGDQNAHTETSLLSIWETNP